MTIAAPQAPTPPSSAREVFGARLPLAVRYAEALAGDGVTHGHLGPREVPRLWSRHLVNCARVTELVPPGAHVVDVGSGAGLPGLPMAIRRPDLDVVLIEPMLRRCEFLRQVVDELHLAGSVSVLRGRADDDPVRHGVSGASWVTARAVAPLARLVEWCLPLLAIGGRLLALKGSTAEAEVDRDRAAVHRSGGRVLGVTVLAGPTVTDGADRGAVARDVTDEPTRVIVVERAQSRQVSGRRSS